MGNSCGCDRSKRKTREGRSPKIRKKSKAHSAGVLEGDEVVIVNGKTVEGQTHMATMEMVDSGDTLQLGLRRGGSPKQAQPKAQVRPQQPAMVQKEEQTGTYSDTLLGQEAKLAKEDRKVGEIRIEENCNLPNERIVPVAKQQVESIQSTGSFIYQPPQSNTTKPIITNGTSLIDDALSKLETFPKVTDAFATSSESFQQASIANQQVTSNFPTETVTAELREDCKENIAPVKYSDYSSVSRAPPSIPTFHVKPVDVNKSIWQPGGSSTGARPNQQQQRGPSMIDFQKNKFQKSAPPPPKPKPKPSRQKQPAGPEPFQPLRQVQQSQNFHPAPPDDNLIVSPKHHRKMPHIFGPPVTISIDPSEERDSDSDSSIIRKKKLFSDSAFYDDPNAVYPTIDEQMKLCKTIALSLTSDANKRARGARMFAKRQKRAPKWIHEGHMDMSSSGGDVGHLDDLESELSPDDGGNKPLFSFKIPKVAQQKHEPGKMSLSQDEFERLRLDKHRCEHKTVSPNTCFNLVSDLTSAKGRGAKIFEKRRAKAEEWVVDSSNVPKSAKPSPLSPGTGRLADMLHSPPKPQKSPWEAALENPYGNVDAAFQHLSEYERMQLLNNNPLPEPIPVPMHSKLPPGEQASLLQGPNFNRTAKGWMPSTDGTPTEDLGVDYSRLNRKTSLPEQPYTGRQPGQYRDYNPKPKAWKAPEAYNAPRSLQQEQQQSYSHRNSTSSVSYNQNGGRWPSSQVSNSYGYDSHMMGQPQYGGFNQQQQTLYGTDL